MQGVRKQGIRDEALRARARGFDVLSLIRVHELCLSQIAILAPGEQSTAPLAQSNGAPHHSDGANATCHQLHSEALSYSFIVKLRESACHHCLLLTLGALACLFLDLGRLTLGALACLFLDLGEKRT